MSIFRSTYLSLGSNQGNRLEHLQQAVDLLAVHVGIIEKISPIYQTEAVGFEGDDFYNLCLLLRTRLSPEKLLGEILEIESLLGRIRTTKSTYESRTIDIDILFFEDEIIFSKNLIVPHQELIKRRFVLQPLSDIAPNFIHPIEKKSIRTLLHSCMDHSSVNPINHTLKKPISLSEKYNYIAIEGNIGAGKTTLTNMLANDFNAKKVLERFADNPFLPKFYKDEERYAFPLEMSFLADRYQQLSDDLAQFDLFKNFIISDYYIFKSLIFAQVTLATEEYQLYRRMFDIMYNEITKPDLYIYLYQNTSRLLDNIKKRGRDYEQNISGDYLNKIHKGYASFIQSEKELNTLIIDVSELDFVSDKSDYRKIIKEIINS
ncbi:MAG TPA: 2-amino-4-hydroxy-6-hydroxymethyldihydropteridine diphosphokinase [Saprospiraceae bacterium]|nr:2-amino-4-hydroxy-6-hydroxymethyldihydropteridine diphosphokinase [Saprospiraceae bacterium]